MSSRDLKMKPIKLSRGISYTGDTQVQLQSALRDNDFDTFQKLISNKAVTLSYEYGFQTILELAISEPKREDFVKLLLKCEDLDVNKINKISKFAPIHFAVENGNIDALSALLEDDRIDVNVQSNGNTALLWAIKKMYDNDRKGDFAIYEDMVKVLLEAGCNVNTPDLKDTTPLAFAAEKRHEGIVTLILEHCKQKQKPIFMNKYKDMYGKTARDYLKEAFPRLLNKYKTKEPEVIDVDKLFSYLNNNEEDNFIRDFTEFVKNNDHRDKALAADNGKGTMLQVATKKGFDRAVETLLNSGADPNATCSCNSFRPIEYACQKGHHKILKMFVDNESALFDAVNGESLLQITVKGMRSYSNTPKVNFNKCLELLRKHNVNHSNDKGNTALHYAARNGENETVLELLRNGACVGLRNQFNEPPLADINAKTLETYLDECVTTKGERLDDDNFEIHMDYNFLVYPKNTLVRNTCEQPLVDNSKELDSTLAPEIDALLYMTTNEELRPLLKHPVITTFLYLKWERMSCLFRANILFYSLFCLCLYLYILLGYTVEKKESGMLETLNVISHVGVIIGMILIIFRELFQFLVSPIRYVKSFENLMEMILIIVTASIISTASADETVKRQLSAVAILLSSVELVILIGQFPTLSTNIVILKTVTLNFLKILLWYCILIIAFAFSFYTLFRENEQNLNDTTTNKTKQEEAENFFDDPGRSLFKTIIMLTGEFDAGSIKFSTFPVTSHIIFIVFVFMIPIVLFNLLNGLAVSDTQEIRADAELVGHISRVKLISYFESVLIGHSKSYSGTSASRSWVPSSFANTKMFCIKAFAKRRTLFPYILPNNRIIIKPNQNIVIVNVYKGESSNDNKDAENGRRDINCFKHYQNNSLNRKIAKNARTFVIDKKTNVTDFDKIKAELSKYESKIDNIESTMKEIVQALKKNQPSAFQAARTEVPEQNKQG